MNAGSRQRIRGIYAAHPVMPLKNLMQNNAVEKSAEAESKQDPSGGRKATGPKRVRCVVQRDKQHGVWHAALVRLDRSKRRALLYT